MHVGGYVGKRKKDRGAWERERKGEKILIPLNNSHASAYSMPALSRDWICEPSDVSPFLLKPVVVGLRENKKARVGYKY